MAFNVSQLLSDLNRRVSPGTTSQSRDIYGSISDGARNLLARVKPKELSRRIIIENALYDQVNRFSCPEDLQEQAIVQWFKLNRSDGASYNGGAGYSRNNVDTFFHPMRQVTNRRFDERRTNDKNIFTVEWQSGVKFIKVSDFKCENGQTINDMNSLTSNGTWNVFGSLVNLTIDDMNYIAGNGALRFDFNTSSGSGGIFNYTMQPIDLSSYFVKGKIFTWIDLPNLNQLQTVTLDLFTNASDFSTDYYSMTVNSPHDTTQFQLGWNLMGFAFDPSAGMSIIGTPNPANIVAMKFTFVVNGTLLMNSVRLDNVVARKGSVYGIQYVSQFMFQDADTGLWKLAPTKPSDIINLVPETYNLLISECSYRLAQEIVTDNTKIANFATQLEKDYVYYKKIHKEEFIDEQQQFYNFGVPFGYRRGWSGWDEHRFDHGQDHI